MEHRCSQHSEFLQPGRTPGIGVAVALYRPLLDLALQIPDCETLRSRWNPVIAMSCSEAVSRNFYDTE